MINNTWPPPPTRKPRNRVLIAVVLGVILFITAVIGLVFVLKAASHLTSHGRKVVSLADSLYVGDMRRLDDGRDDPILIAVDMKTENAMSEAGVANDDAALNKLYDSGSIFFVPKDSKAQLIGSDDPNGLGPNYFQVRIVGGEDNGKEGWIPMDWFKP